MHVQFQNKANEPMELIPVPAALLARRLRSRLWCQKRAGIPHRRRWPENMNPLAIIAKIIAAIAAFWASLSDAQKKRHFSQ